MKRTLILLCKLGFWLSFIYNVGVIQMMNSAHDEKPMPWAVVISDTSHNIESRAKLGGMLYHYYQHKLDAAKIKATHQSYTPLDYFTDMRSVDDFRKRNGIAESVFGGYTELQQDMQSSIGHHGITYDDIPKARDRVYPEMAAWDKAHPEKPIDWGGIGSWLLKLYLKMLPMAALYLLLWMYEENDCKRFKFRNPLSFLLSLLLHPFIIGYILYMYVADKGREVVASIEVRRTKKKLFSLLSEDEVALVKSFARSNLSLKQFRHQLTVGSRVVHHSFMMALIATMILYCAPSMATASQQTRCHISKLATSCHIHSHALQKTSRVEPGGEVWREDLPLIALHFITLAKHQFKHFILSLSGGFPHCMEPIPLKVTTLSKNKLVHLKKNHDEKIYNVCSRANTYERI